MRELVISWQRLVDDGGATCPRCRATGTHVRAAALLLQARLLPRAFRISVRATALSRSEFSSDPLSSNLVSIDDTPIESLLDGGVGKSPCCSACGDSDCRTVSVLGRTYETIPVALIVRAGLIAARRLRRKRNRS